MKFSLILLSLILGSSLWTVERNLHDFHVSTTYMEEKGSELQISVSIFTDDLNRSLENRIGKNPFLGDENELYFTDSILEIYLTEHFKMSLDGAPKTFEYLGKEVENDICWMYLESKSVSEGKSLQVDCTLLFDLFEDQSNVVNYKSDKTESRKIQRYTDGPIVFNL